MDQRLADAARVGDVVALHKILEEEPLMLKKVCLVPFAESPLHVAALAGKTEFAREMISLMPSLATHTNQQGLIPLHMASAEGHVEIVRELLKANTSVEVNNSQCVVKDNEGRTSLHYAAFKGRVGVIEELVSGCPGCLEEITAKGETVLHMAVKGNQFGVVEMLMERLKTLSSFQGLLKAKDVEGKTAHQLAAAKKQFQVLNILKEDGKGDIKEEHCLTMEDHPESETSKIEANISLPENKASQIPGGEAGKDQYQDAILVVATLIVTLTYEGLLNPPSAIFKQGTELNWGCVFHGAQRIGSLKPLQTCPAISAFNFLLFNSLVFLISIFLIIWNLRGPRASLVAPSLLTISLTFNYCTLIMALSYETAYFAYPILMGAAFILVACVFLRVEGVFAKIKRRNK